MNVSVILTFLRYVVGVGLLWLAWQLGTQEQDPIDPTRLLLAAAASLAGITFLWTLLFRFATRPLFLLVDQIFSPGGRLEKPPLNLKLPAHYLDETRYEEALEEYRKILRFYPEETEAWEKSIWLEAAVFHRPAKARSLLRSARRRKLCLDPVIVDLAERAQPH